MKPLSIPKLELQAALLASRLRLEIKIKKEKKSKDHTCGQIALLYCSVELFQ